MIMMKHILRACTISLSFYSKSDIAAVIITFKIEHILLLYK